MVTLVRITVKVYSQAKTEEKSELQQDLGGADSTAEVPDICNETLGQCCRAGSVWIRSYLLNGSRIWIRNCCENDCLPFYDLIYALN